jgi:hypothetical protein
VRPSVGIAVPFANFGTHMLCDLKHHDWAEHWVSLEQVWALAGGLYRTPAIAIATRKAQTKRSAQRKFIRRCSPTSITQYVAAHRAARPRRKHNWDTILAGVNGSGIKPPSSFVRRMSLFVARPGHTVEAPACLLSGDERNL